MNTIISVLMYKWCICAQCAFQYLPDESSIYGSVLRVSNCKRGCNVLFLFLHGFGTLWKRLYINVQLWTVSTKQICKFYANKKIGRHVDKNDECNFMYDSIWIRHITKF